ncbi:MAG: TMEM165/GDT1 family protein [candidate division WOR-3 bacterium]|nr:TMEM165/GDT1 family protein [candidate division WOR-3 bacterium]
MDFKLFAMTFVSVFLAELGDKTQLATVGFAASGKSPWIVFLGSACALILSSLLGVIVGAGLQKILPVRIIHIISGLLFIGIGILLIIRNTRL